VAQRSRNGTTPLFVIKSLQHDLKFGSKRSHHIILQHIQKRLKKLGAFAESADMDDTPVALLTRGDHWYPKGLHVHLGASGVSWQHLNHFQRADDLLNALENAYKQGHRHELAEIVAKWRASLAPP
jgi:hypothetical protein